MTPIRLSYIWYRRLYAALFLASLSYVALYALETLAVFAFPETLRVDIVAAIGATIVALASVVLWVMAKKITSHWPAFAAFIVFTLVTAYLVQQTGGVYSLFLAVWVLVAFAAPLFSAWGWLPIIILIGVHLAITYLNQSMGVQSITALVLSSVVPLIAGIILWRDPPGMDELAHSSVKSLASQLSEVAAKSEIVINAIGDGVIAVDGKGVIQLINPAAQESLGWGKQDALMLSYKSILKLTDENNADLDPTQDPIEQVLNTNQQARGSKLSATTKTGKKLSVALVVSPIGEPGSGAIAVFRDVTNERAEEREQAEFISTASHEMRTPVAAIEGYLGLALNPNTATIDTKARDFIMKAHESAQHLGRLFQDLLDVSKSEDGRMQNIPKVVDIVPYVQSIVEGLNQKAVEKGLTLTFVPNEGSGSTKKIMPVYFVNQDNNHIREVLDNLIENAIKYTPQGEVSVDVTGTEDKVVVSIKDTGLGIPTEDIPHLFQKFYRVSNSDRQQIGGTGLGLYLSRRLAEGMQGRLWVESTFGQGSTFFVELPRVTTQEAERLKIEQAAQTPSTPAPVPTPVQIPVQIPIQTPDQTPVTQPAAQPTAPQPVAASPALQRPSVAQLSPQPQAAPQAPPQAVQQAPAQPATTARPATTVPRGDSLTRDQINEHVRRLEELAQQQRAPEQGRQ